MKTLRLGIAGCGLFTQMIGIPAMKKIRNIEVTALCDINEERLRKSNRLAKSARIYTNYSEFLADSAVDAVYICTPPEYHYGMMLDAIGAEKHILCEKPLTVSYEQALDIKDRLDGSIVLMPSHNYSYAPCLDLASASIQNGAIGDILHIDNTFDININFWQSFSKHQFHPEYGGALYDHFPHVVYTIFPFAGRIKEIENVKLERSRRGVNDLVSLNGVTDRGISYSLRASWRSMLPKWKMDIVGTDGKINIDPRGNFHWITVKNSAGKVIYKKRGKSRLEQFLSYHLTYKNQFEDFVQAVLDRGETRVTFGDSVETMRVIDRVAAANKRLVKPRIVIDDLVYNDSAFGTIDRLIDRFQIDFRDKNVLLKPNMLGPWKPEKGVTTHPVVVEAVKRAVEKRGGKVTVGDNPGTGSYGRSDSSAEATGIKTASGKSWRELGLNPVKVSVSSKHFKELIVSSEVMDADILINIPKFKTHTLTTITGSIKNMFGILVGGQKMNVHSTCPSPDVFADALVDIYLVRKPDLTILDAGTVMEGNGPTTGTLRTVNKVIASDDGVAVDAVMAAMIGVRPDDIAMLKAAAAKDAGETDIENMDITGSMPKIGKFKLPPGILKSGFIGAIVNKFMGSFLNKPYFVIDKKRCEQCGVCVKHCPRQAIQLKPFPVVKRKNCIGCYCCFELCPHEAIRLGNPMVSLANTGK
ncbi:MAG: DUF362 domain-containing protein [Spirochaetales bacterium]|nr:DUF362 domain-containing protein [Spirochaetales bacterium]